MTTPSRATSLRPRRRRRSPGIRSIEIAVAIAIGVMSAVFIAAKADELPARSSSAGCTISQLAAERAALVYFAGPGAGKWPLDLLSLIAGEKPILRLPDHVAQTGPMTLVGANWTLTMHAGGNAEPTFTCA